MASQAQAGTLDVSEFLGGLKVGSYHKWLILICSFVCFFDGMDFSLVSVALPEIQKGLHLTDAMLGPVSSAAFLGQMIGSLAGSYVADVFGRRPVILVCTVVGALLTFVTGFSESAEMLIALRFFGGLAIGGLLAPAWAINIESMPRAFGATAVTIIMLGFSLGGAAAAQITNFIAPDYGWQGVFFFAGAMTGVLALVLQFTLPESARWMVAKKKPLAAVMPLLKRFDPKLAAERYSTATLSDERQVSTNDSSPFVIRIGGREFRIRPDSPNLLARWSAQFLKAMSELFKGTLAWITPIIWVTYFCSSFAIYIKASFGVKFLQVLEVPVDLARDFASIGGLIGAVGAVFLLMFTEKRGPIWIALAPLVGVPFALLVGLGTVPVGGQAFYAVIMLGMIAIGVGHASVISITSIYYPSAVRSTGGGWASFMAKFAAVLAPMVAANLFLGSKQAVLDGYSFVGLCLAGVVVGIVALSVFAKRLSVEHFEPMAEPEPGVA